MRPDSLARFILRTLAWLPVCFAIWFWTATYVAPVVGSLARVSIAAFAPRLVTGLERDGIDLVFVTGLEIHPAPGQAALVLVDINPLVYTYGLGLFAALMLAARSRLWKLAVGALSLLPFQAWGVAFDFLVQVGVTLGPEVAVQAAFTSAQREAIALGYQAGALIFPTLAPVALWACLNQPFLKGLMGFPAPEATAAT